ncbi:MAG: chemotaxis protein CheW [Magnetococcales bacterium]|nr:chemotaxis protein CheW [Magnetococcales bacterium]
MIPSPLDQMLATRLENRNQVVSVDEPTVKVVIFELGGALFAVYGANIREILANARIFFVPGCPASMEGVINVRGDIETVIRLQSLLQLPDAQSERPPVVLLARGCGVNSGIRVDRVLDVLDVTRGTILPAPPTLPVHWNGLALGVMHAEERLVTLLDLEAVLNDYVRGLG